MFNSYFKHLKVKISHNGYDLFFLIIILFFLNYASIVLDAPTMALSTNYAGIMYT